MPTRKIIEINRDECNGCGLCTTACAEGALVLDEEKKAVLVKEIYCDGLGACLDVCPTGALKIVEREALPYDEQATHQHVMKTKTNEPHCACPGSLPQEFEKPKKEGESNAPNKIPSELSQWPIQLHLIAPYAPYFKNCDLLIAADCTAFALGSFHPELLKGKKLVIACPKLDDTDGYLEKLTELFKINDIRSVTVAIMEVPCCGGLDRLARQALELSGKEFLIKTITVSLQGELQN
jgi:ferredoxin